MSKVQEHATLAEAAGFTHAADNARTEADRATRLARAYEFYRYVKQEAVDAFNRRLKHATLEREGKPRRDLYEKYDKLIFTAVGGYAALPPADVLEKVAEAKTRGIFDTMEVAQIESVVEYKDPIVFGLISGCTDRFFIAQWGEDVKITDLLGEHDG